MKKILIFGFCFLGVGISAMDIKTKWKKGYYATQSIKIDSNKFGSQEINDIEFGNDDFTTENSDMYKNHDFMRLHNYIMFNYRKDMKHNNKTSNKQVMGLYDLKNNQQIPYDEKITVKFPCLPQNVSMKYISFDNSYVAMEFERRYHIEKKTSFYDFFKEFTQERIDQINKTLILIKELKQKNTVEEIEKWLESNDQVNEIEIFLKDVLKQACLIFDKEKVQKGLEEVIGEVEKQLIVRKKNLQLGAKTVKFITFYETNDIVCSSGFSVGGSKSKCENDSFDLLIKCAEKDIYLSDEPALQCSSKHNLDEQNNVIVVRDMFFGEKKEKKILSVFGDFTNPTLLVKKLMNYSKNLLLAVSNSGDVIAAYNPDDQTLTISTVWATPFGNFSQNDGYIDEREEEKKLI